MACGKNILNIKYKIIKYKYKNIEYKNKIIEYKYKLYEHKNIFGILQPSTHHTNKLCFCDFTSTVGVQYAR